MPPPIEHQWVPAVMVHAEAVARQDVKQVVVHYVVEVAMVAAMDVQIVIAVLARVYHVAVVLDVQVQAHRHPEYRALYKHVWDHVVVIVMEDVIVAPDVLGAMEVAMATVMDHALGHVQLLI